MQTLFIYFFLIQHSFVPINYYLFLWEEEMFALYMDNSRVFLIMSGIHVFLLKKKKGMERNDKKNKFSPIK